MLCVNECAFLYNKDFHSLEFLGIQYISSKLLFHNHFGDCYCIIVFVLVILLAYA
jgi:hypothetical protein